MLFHKWSVRLATVFTVALPATSSGQTANPSALYWDCAQQFDDMYHVRCVPRRQDMPELAPTAAAFPGEDRRPGGGGTRDARPVAQRGDAEVFSMPAWNVPLYSLPIDAPFVAELLRSVLCGRAPACKVDYDLPELRGMGSVRTSRFAPDSERN